MKDAKYRFSVVIPIYNVAEYLEEAIESVIGQDIGFEENIQMILVNDGSTDESEKICKKYTGKYPENIIYVKQDNQGVSAARNHGMQKVQGKYVNFLDGDDKWSSDTFSEVYRFFEKNYGQIDLVACKQEFFEGLTGRHPLSEKKFDRNRVIDILYEYDSLQLHVTASFLKAEVLGNSGFREGMRYGEDALYVTETILKKCKYGIVTEPTHYYRKRLNQTSALQGKELSRDWYLLTPDYFYKKLIQESKERWGRVIPYIQYLVCYDLQWRVRDRVEQVLDENGQKEYLEKIKELLKDCEDILILQQRKMMLEQKIFVLCLKYGRDIRPELRYMDGGVYYKNVCVSDIQKNGFARIEKFRVSGSELEVIGQCTSVYGDGISIVIRTSGNQCYPAEMKGISGECRAVWGHNIADMQVFQVKLPLEETFSFQMLAKYQNQPFCYDPGKNGKFLKFYPDMEQDYLEEKGYLITRKDGTVFVRKGPSLSIETKEAAYQQELEAICELPESDDATKEKIRTALQYRKKYFSWKKRVKKEIWLISDKTDEAGGRGEEAFRYWRKHMPKNVKVYFVISQKAADYKRMKKVGSVIPYGSKKHKRYTLLAEKIMFSQVEDKVYDPFYEESKYMGKLYHNQFVFLSEEVTREGYGQEI